MSLNKFSKRLNNNLFLIMSHRGFWGGNIIENSMEASQLAYKAGADIVEVDVCKTSDDKYYLFHDGNEPKLLNRQENFKKLSSNEVENSKVYNSIGTVSGKKINTLSEFLQWLPENRLVNIDRSWDYWDDPDFFSIIKESGKESQLFFKSPVAKQHLDAFLKNGGGLYYVPILKNRAEFEQVRSYERIRMIGVELIVTDLKSELLDSGWLKLIKYMGLFTVANSENLGPDFNLFGGITDDSVLFEETTWDAFTKRGIDIIQTDWPNFVRDYRESLK
ncbi:glycerophosphodiester phosphodiesterase family protein [Alkalibacterium sp. f15]|uniref:glycerophosphodiester phosphodiesterase family protein n=1 Tax=Alkalibacterium sp. f15 TaxID=3414029 RepID=UPI003BF89BF0